MSGKDSGLRIRVEKTLRDEFLEICHAQDRPASQVIRWSTPRVYDDLVRRALLVARANNQPTSVGRHRQAVSRPILRGCHISFVAGHVVEASFHVRYGERSRAIAARFEILDDRWQCSALEFA